MPARRGQQYPESLNLESKGRRTIAKKILIVDDELDMRIYVTTLLETNGFIPLSATNGEEGLELARLEKPSLIILDLMMPKMGGIKMYQELKKDPDLKETPVIMLSAIAEKTFSHSYKIMSQQAGDEVRMPAAYIEKPPEAEQLLEAIEKNLKHHE